MQVIISFEDQFRNDLIFNFSIINSTNQIIELDPIKMFLQIEKTYPPDYYENETVIYSPIDPEKQINKLRKQLRNTTVSKLNTDAAYVFVSLAELVKDFSDLENGKTSDEQYQNYLINEERNQSFNLQNINYQNAIRNLSVTKYYWENYALRKTTLYPRDVISGFVHFPLDERAREISVVIKINDNDISFKYSSRPLINRFSN